MKLSEIKTYHSYVAARRYYTNYYAYCRCEVVKSQSKKGMYKFVVVDRCEGNYPFVGSIKRQYAHPIYTVNKLYTAHEIRALAKLQQRANKA